MDSSDDDESSRLRPCTLSSILTALVAGEATAEGATETEADAAVLPTALPTAEVIAEGAMLLNAVGGAVERGGRSWTIDRLVKEGT